MKKIITGIKKVDDKIINEIKNQLSNNKDLINNCGEDSINSKHFLWVESLTAYIRLIDPKGRMSSFNFNGDFIRDEGTLATDWYKSRYYDLVNRTISKYEQTRSFLNYMKILNELIILKEAKVALDIVTPNKENKVESHAGIFHKKDLKEKNNLVFVLMPFTEKWSKYIWEEEIKKIVNGIKKHSLECKRADDLYGHDVMQDIYNSILSAKIIIADITNKNANVFYELGIAHTLGKNVILLAQGTEYIPFDLNRYRHIIYSNDGEGYKILRKEIPNAIKCILEEDNKAE